jgi:hypothetical protein
MSHVEALKLALEALQDNQHLVADNERHAYVMEYNDLIEKCKEALAQQCVCGEPNSAGTHRTDGPCLAPQRKPDHTEDNLEMVEKQEPVVWMYQDKSTHEVRFQKHMRAFVDHGATYETPLYTTPPQRTWVGLNWDDLPEIYVGDIAFLHGAKWAEAKLREKNSL